MNCPACNGNIPEGVYFCPYCGKAVQINKQKFWLMAGLAGVFAGAAIALVYQLFKERELWLSQTPSQNKSSVEEDDELMDF
ncbi:hypothetical protein Thein_0861 [Thermodesulfatator indicus DSM 15286]|uniref:Zinc-ribbon domain-containing protein n=1 Tax=Thermodesulfatator indicus (strain DSM 15286 / JCM 11887 / CIR29812) TaxID=667014 RepID=F8ACU7_THEID|nr:hypothetical protein [Thermodesulfatator indicus]AEH44738.1 hypothetical protein Thein_0861 [Thermodesulfatator indicus DSM 15286]